MTVYRCLPKIICKMGMARVEKRSSFRNPINCLITISKKDIGYRRRNCHWY